MERDALTFTRYELAFDMATEPGKIVVDGRIWLRNDSERPERHAVLQISSTLSWESIRVAQASADYLVQTYTSDIDHTGALNEAIINLPSPVAPKAAIELSVRYSGTIPLTSVRLERIGLSEALARQSDWDQVTPGFSALRGMGYVVWYPVAMEAVSISEPEFHSGVEDWKRRHQDASMRLRLQYPANLELATSGELREKASAGLAEIQFSHLGRDVPAIVAGPYRSEVRSLGSGGERVAELRFHYLTGHDAAAATYWTEAQQPAALVRDWFGPIEREAQIIELPHAGDASFESGRTLLTPLSETDPKQAAVVLAHEFVHAAFSSPRPWIEEGLAHLAQALEREQQGGREAALRFLASRLPPLIEAEKSRESGNSLIDSADEVYYRTKALYCWWMLRDIVGDTALQHAIRRYRPGEDRDPALIERLLEAASGGHRLDWFFNDWVYRDAGLPEFQVSAVNARETLPGYFVVAVTVENTGGAEAEVPVGVHTAVSDARSRLRVPAHGKATVRIQIGQYPTSVTVNDGSVPESAPSDHRFPVPPQSR